MAAIPRAVREAVYERDGHQCIYCGITSEELWSGLRLGPYWLYHLTLDHLIPRCYGGTDDPWNLATACHHCNTSRQERGTARTIQVLAQNLARELA